jgi:hypothetical protein
VAGAPAGTSFPALLAAVVVSLGTAGCGADEDVLSIHCANLQQKGWFAGLGWSTWSVHRADDRRVMAEPPPQPTGIRWRIEEGWLAAVADGGPPVIVAAFKILAHISAVPDPKPVCGYSEDSDEKPWRDRAVFRVDFSQSPVPPPGLFVPTAQVETAWSAPEDIDEVGVRIDESGGELPLSFVARLADDTEWGHVVLRLRWENWRE